jgi:hypothetical protein
MANDHRGRDVHAGKRSDDDYRRQVMQAAAMRRASRLAGEHASGMFPGYTPQGPAASVGRYDQPEEGYRTPDIMWDNPESPSVASDY